MAKKISSKIVDIDSAREGALASFLTQMSKEKPNQVLRLNDSTRTNIEVVPTGAVSLDVAIGAGGFPRGKIIELFGPEGSGKTTVALSVAANVQKLGGNVGFIDAEHGLNRQLCDNIGIDASRFVVNQPDSGEDAIDMIESMIKSGAFEVIIVDSVAAMIPKAEIDGDMDQVFMGLHARLMSRFMRRIAALANEAGVMLILINQVRANLGAYGSPETTTGGKAIKFYSSLRVEVRTSAAKKITRGNDVVGHTVVATVKKNRLGAPFKTAEFDIIYGQGVDATGSLLDVAEQTGVVSRSGAYYTEVASGERFSEKDPEGRVRAAVGKEAVKQLLRDDSVLRSRIEDAVYQSISAGITVVDSDITLE